MSKTPTISLLLLSLGLLLAPSPANAQETVVIRNAKVVTVSGETIKKGTIVIKDGRISHILTSTKGPAPYDFDAKVIDAADKVVFPGMVLAHSSFGMDRPNERLPVAPFLDVYDSIDPSSLFFEDSLRDGVTSIHVIHGNDTVIGGLGRVVHPIGMTVDTMTAKPVTGLKIVVAGKRGFDRVQQRALLREVFAELADYLENVAEKRYEEEEKKAKREITVPPEKARELGKKLVREQDLDDKHKNLYRLTRGRLDAFVTIERAQDVRFAIELATEHGFLKRTTFVLGGDCYKAIGLLKKAGRPVVLPSRLVYRERNPETGKDDETFLPKVFADAKVPFALINNPRSSLAERFLWYQAARCVREGVDRRTALAAITTVPAKILGLESRQGSIAVGRDGDLLILSGDLLSAQTHVETVVIGGSVVYERSKDFRLRRLIGGPGAETPTKSEDEEKKAEKKTKPEKPGPAGPGKTGSKTGSK